jgi:hypothetical protein
MGTTLGQSSVIFNPMQSSPSAMSNANFIPSQIHHHGQQQLLQQQHQYTPMTPTSPGMTTNDLHREMNINKRN